MQEYIKQLLTNAISDMKSSGKLNEDIVCDIHITRSKDKSHGDFSANTALQLSASVNIPARELAQEWKEKISGDPAFSKIEIAGPGFLNFYIHESKHADVLDSILSKQNEFGRTNINAGNKVHFEFVSANPTGPLHVGHGRGAAYGATIANLLEATGYDVYREYYVNDAGRQIDILTISVWLRYLELCGETISFPSNAYQGDYIWDIAAGIHREYEDKYRHPSATWMPQLKPNDPQEGDKESNLDVIISNSKNLIGEDGYDVFTKRSLDTITDDIKNDLELFGVHFNNWYSEKSLVLSNKVNSALNVLAQNGHTYEKDGALWFRSTEFGDEKDRVLVRENGQPTYFASDVAYHFDKFERGFDFMIDIWGADHHGYIARINAAIEALGNDNKRLRILLVQFANLYENGEKLSMSTRSGEFVTLRQLRKQVGKDAARFFYVMRKCEQHLDFDLDLATSQSQDNPVYYVQYAHARICSIFEQAGNPETYDIANADHSLLSQEQEKNLIKSLSQFPEKVLAAAEQLAPHTIVNYLRELATAFHSFYNAHQVLVEENSLRNARLKLILATRIVLRNGLTLLDVSAPNKM